MKNNSIKYKNTNNDFVPQIPENWELRKIKFASSLQSGFAFKSSEYSEEGYPVFRIGDILDEININNCPKYPIAKSKGLVDFRVYNGDILIALTGATIGKTALIKNLENFGLLNQRVAKLEKPTKFLYYSFLSKPIQEQIKLISNGSAQENISNKTIENFYIPFPSADQQVAIANFLDKKCEQINQFIADKKQLINLLKEQRQSVINSHVNESENDDSNNWVTHKLKHISDIKFSNVDKLTHKGEVKVKLCNYVDVYKNDYITNNIDFMLATATLEEIEKFKVIKGDIIITKDSESADDIGIPAFVSEDIENLVCAYHLAMIRANQEIILDEFLFRKIESKEVNSQFEVNATGVTRVGLSIADISNVLISYPKDIKIQKEIISKIKSETKTIDETIFKTEEELRLVAEYKEALISNAVTGQLHIV